MSHLDAIKDWEKKAKAAGYDANDMATLCSVSSSQLRRYFASAFGISPQRWLNELRLWHAARILCSGYYVKEVARLLGFADTAQLCHQFKASCGCTPLEYVFRYRERNHHDLGEFQEDIRPNRKDEHVPISPWEVAWEVEEWKLVRKVLTVC